MQLPTPRLPGRNYSSSNCNHEDCWKSFTPGNRGQACSGCRHAYYCNAVCQKAAWPLHKKGCRSMAKLKQQQHSADTPIGERKPNIVQDCTHYIETLGPTLKAATRSAMRIGHPDSLAQDHWLLLLLEYIPPPVERWSKSGETPVGDEFQFFRFRNLVVRPDSALDEEKPLDTDSREKKLRCGGMEAMDPALGDHTSVFLVIKSQTDNEADEYAFATGLYLDVPHTSRIFPPLAERKLNPEPSLLFPMTVCPMPKDQMELATHIMMVNYVDLVLSESAEYLETLPYGPPDGWAEMRRRIGVMMGQCLRKEIPWPLPYYMLK